MSQTERSATDFLALLANNTDGNISGYLDLEMVLRYLNMVMINIKISDASMTMLNIKNERFLDSGKVISA